MATLTVGYEVGRGRSNYGERMISRGPRDLAIAKLQANGYTSAPRCPTVGPVHLGTMRS